MIIDAIKNRRSVRSFLDTPIPQDIINELIEALRWAPSAGNLQSRKFYFVTGEKHKIDLAYAAWQDFIREAPLVIVGCCDYSIRKKYGERGINLYSVQDVSASIMNMLLVAHENGLGSVWVSAFMDGNVSNILGLPQNLRPVVIVPVGYANMGSYPNNPGRKDVKEMVEFIK
jgi:nitroreductase